MTKQQGQGAAVTKQEHITKYLHGLSELLKRLDMGQIENFISLLQQARDEERAIYLFGNGGSGAAASHFICDLNKGSSYGKDVRFKVFCLNDNMATVLAYANDVAYADVFIEQLKNFLRPQDLVVAISGSGNSENVLRAIDYANARGAITVGICGFGGGRLKEKAQHAVHVAVDDMQMVEDAHMAVLHLVMQYFCTH